MNAPVGNFEDFEELDPTNERLSGNRLGYHISSAQNQITNKEIENLEYDSFHSGLENYSNGNQKYPA